MWLGDWGSTARAGEKTAAQQQPWFRVLCFHRLESMAARRRRGSVCLGRVPRWCVYLFARAQEASPQCCGGVKCRRRTAHSPQEKRDPTQRCAAVPGSTACVHTGAQLKRARGRSFGEGPRVTPRGQSASRLQSAEPRLRVSPCVLAGRIHAVGRCSAGRLPVRPPGGVPEPARAAAATSAVCCARAQAPPRGPCGWRGRGGTHVSRRAGGEQQRERQRQCRQPGQPRQPAVERLDTGHPRRCVPGAVQTRLCDVQRGRPPRGACRKLSACLTPLCARLPARVPRRAGWAAEHVGLVDDAHCADQHVHVPGHGGADRLPGTWQTCGESLTDGGLTRRLNLPLQEGTHKSFEYGRYGNPTTRAAEDKLRCVSQRAV